MMRASMLALVLAGCSTEVRDGSSRPREPEWSAHHALELKYRAQIETCYEESKNLLKTGPWRIHDDNRHGAESFRVEAWWGDGQTFAKIHGYRRDHKSATTVEVWSNSLAPDEARDLARTLHGDLGKRLGEEGRD
jgi:hypothetical protein